MTAEVTNKKNAGDSFFDEATQMSDRKKGPIVGNENEMITDFKFIETKKVKLGPVTHSDLARLFVTKFLLISIISIVGIPIVSILFCVIFNLPIEKTDKMIEFSKWAVQVLGPLLGAAIGFYFGGSGGKSS